MRALFQILVGGVVCLALTPVILPWMIWCLRPSYRRRQAIFEDLILEALGSEELRGLVLLDRVNDLVARGNIGVEAFGLGELYGTLLGMERQRLVRSRIVREHSKELEKEINVSYFSRQGSRRRGPASIREAIWNRLAELAGGLQPASS